MLPVSRSCSFGNFPRARVREAVERSSTHHLLRNMRSFDPITLFTNSVFSRNLYLTALPTTSSDPTSTAGPSRPNPKDVYTPQRFNIIEALSATGLRSIRYAQEIPGAK
jgi:tRNA G26 N,N-dimethylase Trm1